MKGFGKIALLFGLLSGLMAYFIIPLHFSQKRSLSPTVKAESALTVDYYKTHCGPVVEETKDRVPGSQKRTFGRFLARMPFNHRFRGIERFVWNQRFEGKFES